MLQLIRNCNLDQAIMKCCRLCENPDKSMDANQITPLMEACGSICLFHDGKFVEEKWLKLIELLLRRGSNPNHFAQYKNLPQNTALTIFLYRANMYSHGIFAEKILKILLQYGADVNSSPYTLLYAVCGTYPHPEIVKLLLQHNVCQTNKFTYKSNIMFTVLDTIKATSHQDNSSLIAIKFMLENGWQKYESEFKDR